MVCAIIGFMETTTRKLKLIVIGNGMAAGKFLSELATLDISKLEVTVFGAEPHGNYNRILLSPVLSGEKDLVDIMINSIEWYQANNIQLHTSRTVTGINRISKMIITDTGEHFSYDKLVIATGSDPFLIPVPGVELQNVITFRDIKDVEMMLMATKELKHAIVIGGGLLGLEAANGLMKRGMNVTVVHLTECLMEKQLDENAAELLQKNLEARGLKFKMSSTTTELTGELKVQAVKFADGSELKADLVVIAAGIRPNISLAESAGLECERGILVNDYLKTSDPDIYALGECVQHAGQTYGLVSPLYEMAKVCAQRLVGHVDSSYQGSVISTKLKVTGIDLFSVGDFNGDHKTETIILHDSRNKIYRKLLIENDRLIGAVLYGDTSHSGWYFDLVFEKTSTEGIRDTLMFGPGMDLGSQNSDRILAA